MTWRFEGLIGQALRGKNSPHSSQFIFCLPLQNSVHSIYRVVSFEIVGTYQIKVRFDDETTQVIDFRPVLEGELFGPLMDLLLFNQVRIDPEVHTLVWPKGADFDPATLHDWPAHEEELRAMARRWSEALAENE